MSKVYRYYQEEADIAIYEELLINNKCIVKMFCGTGKSLLMRNCRIVENKSLVVYVFPSLGLIDQFYAGSLFDFPQDNILKISSEKESTTEPVEIRTFLSKSSNKIICITYQSFKTLLDCLDGIHIDVCIYDEAHHSVGETYQKLIFENDASEKQIFFTATPKNTNGIVMYDRDNLEAGMCGKLVYDYSYLRGVNEEYLNQFEIRIDMFTENTNKSVFESIARAILASGNNQVLTFHSDVNTDRDTSVLNFVNDAEFKRVFKEIQKAEFPQIKKYKKISMVGLSASLNGKQRTKILDKFDESDDNEVMVISSCETIGEGIDTKNANMCVFVDPKTSYVKIIQNIGRIVRKQFGVDKPNSTILIPCWVDKSKYLECGGDREKCDEVIRQDMSADGGNFNGILNVLSALKQEDEDLYDICLHYPDTFSPQEIRSNLEKQGFRIDEPVGDGGLVETMEHLLDADIDYEDYEDCDTDEEIIMRIAEDNDVCVEIHTTSLENPVERYNSECESREVVRLYKTPTEEDDEDVVYQPIVAKGGAKRNGGGFRGPKRANRLNVNVHTNPDVKVLWNITAGFDITKDICSCVIDCEVVQYDPMEVAIGIVKRAKERENNGGDLLPKTTYKKEKRDSPDKEQEHKDRTKLNCWKMALNGHPGWKCSFEVRDYLDSNIPGWRDPVDYEKNALTYALELIQRAKTRENAGGRLLPRVHSTNNNLSEPEKVERKDYIKLVGWREAIQVKNKGLNKKIYCYDSVRDVLDINLPGWRCEFDRLKNAQEIVERSIERVNNGGSLLPRAIYERKNRNTPELEQEKKDATTLGNWKQAIKKNNRVRCPVEVINYLDEHLPGWRDERDNESTALRQAKDIVQRAKDRNGGIAKPPVRHANTLDELLIQEHKDALLIGKWKMAYNQTNKKKLTSYDSVNLYLDEHLPGWRDEIHSDENKLSTAKRIVKNALERRQKGGKLLPRNIVKKDRTTSELEQEAKDAQDLQCWKRALNGSVDWVCPDIVKKYLDDNLPGWRINVSLKAMKDAEDIVQRSLDRQINGGKLLPRDMLNGGREKEQLTTIEAIEHNDNQKLSRWRQALNGTGSTTCSDDLRDYLDKHLPGWRKTETNDEQNMQRAIDIVENANQRKTMGLNFFPKQKANPSTLDEKQELKDNQKLRDWRDIKHNLNQELVSYLDENIPQWSAKNDVVKNAMKTAREIFERAKDREIRNLNLLPRETDKRDTEENEQEYKDAIKIGRWRRALRGKLNGKAVCPEEVCKYLDENLPGWRNECDKMNEAVLIVKRANERKLQKSNIIPRMCCNDKGKRDRGEYDNGMVQEHKDSEKLKIWRYVLEGKRNGIPLDDNVIGYLDRELPGWRPPVNSDARSESTKSTTPNPKPALKKKSMKLSIQSTPSESPEQRRQRTKTEISTLHQHYKTLKSENLNREFKENPNLWHKYHEISETNEQSFPEDEIPRNRVIQELDKIKTKRTKRIVDMGCGKAQIAQYFQQDPRFRFINYDHISSNDTVISCDIANTPLEDETVEICILSLAMWGSNCREYIQEANRILESNGQLYIIEPTKRWSEKDEHGNIIPGKEGSKLIALLEENGFRIARQSVEKFCLFVCNKV
jgi:superfamily II DNA or RNA helicase